MGSAAAGGRGRIAGDLGDGSGKFLARWGAQPASAGSPHYRI